MSLYDNYKLQNSRSVYKYAGAPIEEMTKVGGYLQDSYTQNRESYDVLDQSIGSASVLDADKALFKQRMAGYRTSIADAAKTGNYEDMGTQVRSLSRKFSTDYSPFAANARAVAEEDKNYEERVAKGLSTLSDVNRAKATRAAYKGLQIGEDGKYTNAYKGRQLANYVDVNAKVMDVLKGMKANKLTKGGMEGTITTEGGKYFVKGEHSREEISPERIKEATGIALSDPMVKAYMRQDAELDYAHLSDLKYEDLDGDDYVTQQRVKKDANGRPIPVKGKKGKYEMEGVDIDTIKGAAQKYAEKNGVSFVDAYKAIASQRAYTQKVEAYQNAFGNTMSYHEQLDKQELGEETAGSKEARAKREAKLKETDDLVFETQTTSAPERKPDEILKGISSDSARLAEIDKKLRFGNLGAKDKDVLSGERAAIAARVGQDKQMMLKTANDMAKDLPDTIDGRITKNTGFAGLGRDTKDTRITRGVIVKALAEGRISTFNGNTIIKTDNGTITLDEGFSFSKAGKSLVSAVGNITASMTGRPNELQSVGKAKANPIEKLAGIDDRFNDAVAGNSKERQSTTMSFSLKENHKKQLSDMYSGNSGAYDVYKDGELLEDGDKPASVSINQFNTERAANGNNFMTVDAKDAKGKKAEGVYKVVLKGQNNLNGQLLKQYAPGTNGTVKQLTVNNPVYDAISTAELNAPVSLPAPVSVGGHKVYSTMKEKSPEGNTAIYFLDKNGKKLRDSEGEFYVDSPLEAAKILHQK
jgi:hypothetical protein